MIFVNLKSGFEGTGERASVLIDKLVEAQNETSVPIILVPHDLDIYQAFAKWKGDIWIQHIDYEYGDTGRNSLRLLKDWAVEGRKITGAFLNHSEHKYHSWDKLKLVVEEAHELGIKTMVFGGTQEEFVNVCELKPDFVAFEPAELIASPTTSVAKSEPNEIKKAAEVAKKAGIPLIVGAGVKDAADVRVCVSLGAVGVAVSSAIIRAENPKAVVLDMAKGFGK